MKMAGISDIDRLLEKRSSGMKLSENESHILIHASMMDDIADRIIKAATELQRPNKDKVFALPPLYVSSGCENKCVYCNFREAGQSLSLEEFRGEFRALIDKGYRSIELVFSQDPSIFKHIEPFSLRDQKFDVSGVINYLRIAREELDYAGVGMLTINAPPLDTGSYKNLKEAGLDCFLLWAETFNPLIYAKLHPGYTPKTEQRYRFESYERAHEAGIDLLAGTFLKELYDWRTEETMLCSLDRQLETKFGGGFSIIGTPRYKNGHMNKAGIYLMQDKDYLLNIALDLLIHKGVIWLQTREQWELNEKILGTLGGGFILTMDCSTAPGGYAKKGKGRGQFPTCFYNSEKIISNLKDAGINVVYDWGAEELKEMQRI